MDKIIISFVVITSLYYHELTNKSSHNQIMITIKHLPNPKLYASQWMKLWSFVRLYQLYFYRHDYTHKNNHDRVETRKRISFMSIFRTQESFACISSFPIVPLRLLSACYTSSILTNSLQINTCTTFLRNFSRTFLSTVSRPIPYICWENAPIVHCLGQPGEFQRAPSLGFTLWAFYAF